ncbi:hypothetical protein Tco_0640546 [Tanacetum coccineum]
MEQYMSKTRADCRLGIARPKIDDNDSFELKGQFLKELRDNTFSGSDHEDANKHIKKVLEIVDLFHIPNITQDQVMLRAFSMSLTGAASCWLRTNHLAQSQLGKILRQSFSANIAHMLVLRRKLRKSMSQPVHQSPRGIFIYQSQYTIDLLKKHGIEKCDTISTPMATTKLDADLLALVLEIEEAVWSFWRDIMMKIHPQGWRRSWDDVLRRE